MTVNLLLQVRAQQQHSNYAKWFVACVCRSGKEFLRGRRVFVVPGNP